MDLEDFFEDLIKGKKRKNKWYPGKILFKIVEATLELIGALFTIFVISRIFDFDFTSITSLIGAIVVFLVIRFIVDELG